MATRKGRPAPPYSSPPIPYSLFPIRPLPRGTKPSRSDPKAPAKAAVEVRHLIEPARRGDVTDLQHATAILDQNRVRLLQALLQDAFGDAKAMVLRQVLNVAHRQAELVRHSA